LKLFFFLKFKSEHSEHSEPKVNFKFLNSFLILISIYTYIYNIIFTIHFYFIIFKYIYFTINTLIERKNRSEKWELVISRFLLVNLLIRSKKPLRNHNVIIKSEPWFSKIDFLFPYIYKPPRQNFRNIYKNGSCLINASITI